LVLRFGERPLVPPIQIVPAAAADRSVVADLLARQLDEHAIEIQDDALLAAIDGVLTDERRGFLLLAKDAGRAIGVAYVSLTWSIEHGGKSSWLEELYVLPEWRGRGVGTSMLESVIEEARRRACAAVDLEVESAHERAERLYARHGFARHSRTRWVKALRR
jgi:GNAT superfamily N-acetyltransferase